MGLSPVLLDYVIHTHFVSKKMELILHHILHSEVAVDEFDGIIKVTRKTNVHFNCMESERNYITENLSSKMDEPSRSYYNTLAKIDALKLADTDVLFARYIQTTFDILESRQFMTWHSDTDALMKFVQSSEHLTSDDFTFLTRLYTSKLSDILNLKYGYKALF